MLLVEALVPPYAQAVLALAVFGALVVVSLQLHQRGHDILVVVTIFVLEQHRLYERKSSNTPVVWGTVKPRFPIPKATKSFKHQLPPAGAYPGGEPEHSFATCRTNGTHRRQEDRAPQYYLYLCVYMSGIKL